MGVIENINTFEPCWEGETKEKVTKRIFGIVGSITKKTYIRFKDKKGEYLNDKNDNQLLIPRGINISSMKEIGGKLKDEDIEHKEFM